MLPKSQISCWSSMFYGHSNSSSRHKVKLIWRVCSDLLSVFGNHWIFCAFLYEWVYILIPIQTWSTHAHMLLFIIAGDDRYWPWAATTNCAPMVKLFMGLLMLGRMWQYANLRLQYISNICMHLVETTNCSKNVSSELWWNF